MTREEFISMMGYRDDSPLRNEDSLNIQTGPNGIIDMSNTGMPLMANGRYLPPYSGHHQFEPNSTVTERPALTVKGREGKAGSIGLPNSTHLMQHERLQDGTWIAFPKIFQDENGKWKNFEEINERDGWWENYQYALKRNEVYGPFESEQHAASFAVDGTWKNPTMTPQGEYNQEGFVPYPPENSDQIQQPGEAKFGGSLPKAQTGNLPFGITGQGFSNIQVPGINWAEGVPELTGTEARQGVNVSGLNLSKDFNLGKNWNLNLSNPAFVYARPTLDNMPVSDGGRFTIPFEPKINLSYKFKNGGSLPKFQGDINSETELHQMIEDMEINTQDVDDTEQKEFQRTKISSDEWLNRVIREQEDRGNPVTKAQAIQFQSQALSDLEQGVVKSQTWDEFFGNPVSGGSGTFDFGTQGFNITTPSIWDPKIQMFKPDPSGQIGNTMLINDFSGDDPNPWTFAHETGHNWNWRNPFNNNETSQFLGNTYFGNDNMFNKFNPDLTGAEYDHDRTVGFSGRQVNMGDFGQYQQSSPEIRSEKAALEKELSDLGLYDPTKPFTEQNLRDILASKELSSNAREVLNGLGLKDLLKEQYDINQATSNFENKSLPTELRDLGTKIEQMYSELGSRYNENAHMDANTWHNMSEGERKEHNEEFGTTPREVPDGWGGTMTVEMSDLEYAETLREQARSADLELYGEDAIYGTNALSGWDINSPGYFAYNMGNISDANTTLDYYKNDFMNSTNSAPLLQEVKNAEGLVIGYTDDPNYGGFGSTEGINIIPYSNETKTQFENQSPTGGPTEAQWTTYVDNLFTENESYITDDPESTWGMKIDESLDYTWPAEEGDDDYDPNNIQVNNSLYDLCYDDYGNPTGNPDCTEAHQKRLEDNQSRHEKHRKIDQLGYNANAILDLFGTSTMVHLEHDQDIFNMDAGVVKTAPTSPLMEGMFSELYPEGTEQFEARQRLMQTMTRLKSLTDGKMARLDRESLTPQFIQDMQLVEDGLRNSRLKLQERRQGYVKEYYDGVKKFRGADHEQLIEEQQLELDEKIKNNNITNFMNRVYSQNDQQTSDDIPQTMNARYGKELPRFQKKGEYDWDGWKIATEKSIYPDGEWNWYNPADSWRWLTNENETIPLSPPLPEDPESAKNKSEIPLSWDEYKIEKPKGTIEQYRRYIRNPKYNDWRMHSFDPYTNITKKGWANKEYYRGLDEESMGEVQDWLIEHGYDIKKDNDWGDDTYNALNNYLLDTKLLNKEITSHPLVTDNLLINQQYIESDGKPEAGSHKGALGLVQAMPGAWKDAIKKGILPENAKRTNINHALAFQRYYMNSLMNAEFVTDATSNNEKLARALSAYNWGRGNTPKFFKNINYVATNETIKDKEGRIIESGFRNKLDENGNPILVPEDERRDPFDMKSWMTILDSSKDDTRWTIPQETVDYINLIMFPEQYIKDHGKKKYESRIKSTKKFEDYKKKAKKFYSYKDGGALNRTKQLIRTYKLGGELSGLAIKHLEEIGIIPQYREGGTTYNINDEETLLGIAKKYNTTEKDINQYNNLIDAEPLYKGQVIDIPKPVVKTPLEIKKEAHKLGDYGIFKNMTLDTQIKLYSNYVNGDYMMFSEKLGKKLYDKLNRVYYERARGLNMSVLDYMKSILS